MYTVVMAFLLSLALSSGTRSNTRKNIEFCQKIRLQLLDDDDEEKECRYAPDVYHSESSSSAQGEPARMWFKSSSMSCRICASCGLSLP